MNFFQRMLRTQERGTTSQHVADALNSGDPQQVRAIMRDHGLALGGVANTGNRQNLAVVEEDVGERWRPGRWLGWMRPHRVREFRLVPQDRAPRAPRIDANYLPMTPQDTWGGRVDQQGAQNAFGATLQQGPVNFDRRIRASHRRATVTDQLTGCTLVRSNSGRFGHIQPEATHPANTSQDALRQLQGVASTHGPRDYRVPGVDDQVTNTVMMRRRGSRTVSLVSQTITTPYQERVGVRSDISRIR